jgi:hypothetical protein
MSEKVKITQEQADAIERWENGTQLLKAAVVGLLKHGEDEPIKEMTTETLAKAIYIGYEVEPEYKKGQWAALDNYAVRPIIAKILGIDVEGDGRLRLDWSDHCYWDKERIRHATPSEIAEEKERRFWAKHGRDVWELKEDDVVKGKGYITNLWRLGFVKRRYSNVIVLEDISDGSEIEVHKDLSYVVSFKESRLDVKTNE